MKRIKWNYQIQIKSPTHGTVVASAVFNTKSAAIKAIKMRGIALGDPNAYLPKIEESTN